MIGWLTRGITTPPAGTADPIRWRKINPLRLRCSYWWATSTTLKAAHWILSILTVVAAAISAGHPGSSDPWPPALASEWSTAVVILAGLSGLLPWQTAGLAFERAHERLRDVIMLYDADHSFTVMHVLDAAREARREIQLSASKTPPTSALHAPLGQQTVNHQSAGAGSS